MRPPPRKTFRPEEGRKRIIVAGSRSFDDYQMLKEKLDHYTMYLRDPIILTGGAKGADTLAQKWASYYFYLVKNYYPDYEKYGKAAPLRRNTEMANDGDVLIAFWDGKSHGTKHMIEEAKRKGLKVIIVRFDKQPKKIKVRIR